jgi:hypothetical protein
VTHFLHGSLVDRYFSEPLGPEALSLMFERVWSCGRCRRRYERHLLFERARPDGDARHDERSWDAIARAAGAAPAGAAAASAAAQGARAPSRRGFAILTASLAAAVALALPFIPRHVLQGEPVPPPKKGIQSEPVPRGAVGVEAAPPSLHLYRTREGRSEALQGELRAGDGVLVAYSNPSSDLGYLMVFAVDAAGGVHWYYPGYERLGEDPAAVPIRTRAFGVELGEEIRHELPRGELRMFGLFLPRPMRVLEVEALVGRAFAQSGSPRTLERLELKEGEQTSMLVEVQP